MAAEDAGESALPEFQSALPYTKVRDFAYHRMHPLHYGVRAVGPVSEPASDQEAESTLPTSSSSDDIYRKAIALFDFEPENSNEAALVEGQIVWICYRHGQGWLVAENLTTGETGLVPEEYVQVLPEDSENGWYDESDKEIEEETVDKSNQALSPQANPPSAS